MECIWDFSVNIKRENYKIQSIFIIYFHIKCNYSKIPGIWEQETGKVLEKILILMFKREKRQKWQLRKLS